MPSAQTSWLIATQCQLLTKRAKMPVCVGGLERRGTGARGVPLAKVAGGSWGWGGVGAATAFELSCWVGRSYACRSDPAAAATAGVQAAERDVPRREEDTHWDEGSGRAVRTITTKPVCTRLQL